MAPNRRLDDLTSQIFEYSRCFSISSKLSSSRQSLFFLACFGKCWIHQGLFLGIDRVSVHLDPQIILDHLAVANTCLMHFASLNAYTIYSALSICFNSLHLVGFGLPQEISPWRKFTPSFILDPWISHVTGWYAMPFAFALFQPHLGLINGCQFTTAIGLAH